MTIPRSNRTNTVRIDGRMHRLGYLPRTIENRPDENSGEVSLLPKVQIVWDLWGVGIIGPGLFVGHGSDVDEGERFQPRVG